jgi:hypothetical protein
MDAKLGCQVGISRDIVLTGKYFDGIRPTKPEIRRHTE